MSTGNGNRSWRDRLGLQDQDDGLPKLSTEFGGDQPRESRTPPPPPPANGASEKGQSIAPPPPAAESAPEPVKRAEPAQPEESAASPAAKTFAERLRARREAAERAGEAAGDDLGGGLHLRPPPEEVNGQKTAPPPPPPAKPVDKAAEEKAPPRLMPPPAPEKEKAEAAPPPPPPPAPALKAERPEPAPVRAAPPPPPALPPPAPKVEAEPAAKTPPPPAPPRVPAPPTSMRERDSGDFSSFDRPPGAPDYSGGVATDPGRYSRDVRDVRDPGKPGAAGTPAYGNYSQQTEYPNYSAGSAYGAGRYGQNQDDDLYEDEWYDDDQDGTYGGAHARALDSVDDDGFDDSRRRPELGRPTAGDYADAYYDDYEDGYEEDKGRRRGPMLLFAGLAGVGIIAAVLIYLYMQGQSPTNTANTGTPRVAAPTDNPRSLPDSQPSTSGSDPQTKLFYDRIVGDQTIEGEKIRSREEQPLDPGGSADPQPLQPLTPDQLDSGELPVPLPPPLPGGTSGSLDPSGGQQGTTNVAQTTPPDNQSTVAQASGSETVQPAGLSALPLPGGTTLPDGSDVAPSDSGDTSRSASSGPLDKNTPRPRAKPQRVIEAARRAAQRTRVASVAPITAAPTEPLSISPLPGSAPRVAAPAPTQVQPLPQAPQAPQPAQPARSTFSSGQGASGSSIGQDDASFSRTPSTGQQTAALQPAQQPSAPAPAAPAVASGSYVVQLASYKDQTSALAGFQDLKARHGSLLGRFQPLISKKTVGAFGTFYRLQVGPIANKQSGDKICSSLLAAGEKDCLVKRR